MKGKIFMAVTADEYELPIAIANSVRELAQMLGIPFSTVRGSMFRTAHGLTQGTRNKMKFIVLNEKDVE